MTDHKSAIIFLILGVALTAFPLYVIRKGLRLTGTIMLIGGLSFFPAAYGTYVGNDFWMTFGIAQFFAAALVRTVFGRRILAYDRKKIPSATSSPRNRR